MLKLYSNRLLVSNLEKSYISTNYRLNMMIERISTGISTLDELIEGGIPRGFTIYGNPSTEVLESARAGGLDVKLFSLLTGL